MYDENKEQFEHFAANDNDGGHIPGVQFPQGAPDGERKLDEFYIIGQINAVMRDSAYIRDALATLDKLDTHTDTDGGGYGVQGKAEAIANIVQERENTNRQMLKLLEKLYDNAVRKPEREPNPADGVVARFQTFCDVMEKFRDSDGDYPSEILETIQDISRKIFDPVQSFNK